MTYVRSLWLPDVLQAAGVPVKVHPSFKDGGRPASVGPHDPRALVIHHDASAKGPTPGEPAYLLAGRRDTPGPLAQLWVAYDGTWHCLASGRCNHAGRGVGWGVIPKDSGNTYGIGVESDHTTGEPIPDGFMESLAAGSAAILRYLHAAVDRACMGHKEYARGRKSDPDWDMGAFRALVKGHAVQLAVKRTVNPDGGPWGPCPFGPRAVLGLDHGDRASRFDGTESASAASWVRAVQREVHAPVTGVYDLHTAEKVHAYRSAYNLQTAGVGTMSDVDESTWLFMYHR